MGVLVAPVEARRESGFARAKRRFGEYGWAAALVSAATPLAIAIEGYHPYAEDGGIYVAGVKRLLDARLYPHDAAFAMEPARWTLFAQTVAAIARMTHLRLPWDLLTLHVVCVWATLFSGWMLAARCFARWEARAGAVVLLACWLGLPVAGTALYVMDPYLTARSFATPAMLLAMAGALEWCVSKPGPGSRREWAMWAGGLAVCAATHPLTALYAGVATAILMCVSERRRATQAWGTAAVCAVFLAGAASTQAFAPPESAVYVRAALTRSYWFLNEWRWYELMGLAAPIAILGIVGWFQDEPRSGWARFRGTQSRAFVTSVAPIFMEVRRTLARMAVIVGALACVATLVFARENVATHLVAQMQPMRMFQIVYLIMIVMLGGWLGDRMLKNVAWRWCAALVALGGVMFGAARAEYRSTDQLELPWIAPGNAWVRGFDWVRTNTPRDAFFAMDADYIHAPGEDAQNFRAIAERSALADLSKDGGEASIAPDLAQPWARGVAAQAGLNSLSDPERMARLKPLGVTWMVLDADARTQFGCPYRNDEVQVCELR